MTNHHHHHSNSSASNRGGSLATNRYLAAIQTNVAGSTSTTSFSTDRSTNPTSDKNTDNNSYIHKRSRPRSTKKDRSTTPPPTLGFRHEQKNSPSGHYHQQLQYIDPPIQSRNGSSSPSYTRKSDSSNRDTSLTFGEEEEECQRYNDNDEIMTPVPEPIPILPAVEELQDVSTRGDERKRRWAKEKMKRRQAFLEGDSSKSNGGVASTGVIGTESDTARARQWNPTRHVTQVNLAHPQQPPPPSPIPTTSLLSRKDDPQPLPSITNQFQSTRNMWHTREPTEHEAVQPSANKVVISDAFKHDNEVVIRENNRRRPKFVSGDRHWMAKGGIGDHDNNLSLSQPAVSDNWNDNVSSPTNLSDKENTENGGTSSLHQDNQGLVMTSTLTNIDGNKGDREDIEVLCDNTNSTQIMSMDQNRDPVADQPSSLPTNSKKQNILQKRNRQFDSTCSKGRSNVLLTAANTTAAATIGATANTTAAATNSTAQNSRKFWQSKADISPTKQRHMKATASSIVEKSDVELPLRQRNVQAKSSLLTTQNRRPTTVGRLKNEDNGNKLSSLVTCRDTNANVRALGTKLKVNTEFEENLSPTKKSILRPKLMQTEQSTPQPNFTIASCSHEKANGSSSQKIPGRSKPHSSPISSNTTNSSFQQHTRTPKVGKMDVEKFEVSLSLRTQSKIAPNDVDDDGCDTCSKDNAPSLPQHHLQDIKKGSAGINYLSSIKKEQSLVGDENVLLKKDLTVTPKRIDLPKSQERDNDDCGICFKDTSSSKAQYHMQDVKKKNPSTTYLSSIKKAQLKAGDNVSNESLPPTSQQFVQGIIRAKIQEHGESSSSCSNMSVPLITGEGNTDVDRPHNKYLAITGDTKSNNSKRFNHLPQSTEELTSKIDLREFKDNLPQNTLHHGDSLLSQDTTLINRSPAKRKGKLPVKIGKVDVKKFEVSHQSLTTCHRGLSRNMTVEANDKSGESCPKENRASAPLNKDNSWTRSTRCGDAYLSSIKSKHLNDRVIIPKKESQGRMIDTTEDINKSQNVASSLGNCSNDCQSKMGDNPENTEFATRERKELSQPTTISTKPWGLPNKCQALMKLRRQPGSRKLSKRQQIQNFTDDLKLSVSPTTVSIQPEQTDPTSRKENTMTNAYIANIEKISVPENNNRKNKSNATLSAGEKENFVSVRARLHCWNDKRGVDSDRGYPETNPLSPRDTSDMEKEIDENAGSAISLNNGVESNKPMEESIKESPNSGGDNTDCPSKLSLSRRWNAAVKRKEVHKNTSLQLEICDNEGNSQYRKNHVQSFNGLDYPNNKHDNTKPDCNIISVEQLKPDDSVSGKAMLNKGKYAVDIPMPVTSQCIALNANSGKLGSVKSQSEIMDDCGGRIMEDKEAGKTDFRRQNNRQTGVTDNFTPRSSVFKMWDTIANSKNHILQQNSLTSAKKNFGENNLNMGLCINGLDEGQHTTLESNDRKLANKVGSSSPSKVGTKNGPTQKMSALNKWRMITNKEPHNSPVFRKKVSEQEDLTRRSHDEVPSFGQVYDKNTCENDSGKIDSADNKVKVESQDLSLEFANAARKFLKKHDTGKQCEEFFEKQSVEKADDKTDRIIISNERNDGEEVEQITLGKVTSNKGSRKPVPSAEVSTNRVARIAVAFSSADQPDTDAIGSKSDTDEPDIKSNVCRSIGLRSLVTSVSPCAQQKQINYNFPATTNSDNRKEQLSDDLVANGDVPEKSLSTRPSDKIVDIDIDSTKGKVEDTTTKKVEDSTKSNSNLSEKKTEKARPINGLKLKTKSATSKKFSSLLSKFESIKKVNSVTESQTHEAQFSASYEEDEMQTSPIESINKDETQIAENKISTFEDETQITQSSLRNGNNNCAPHDYHNDGDILDKTGKLLVKEDRSDTVDNSLKSKVSLSPSIFAQNTADNVASFFSTSVTPTQNIASIDSSMFKFNEGNITTEIDPTTPLPMSDTVDNVANVKSPTSSSIQSIQNIAPENMVSSCTSPSVTPSQDVVSTHSSISKYDEGDIKKEGQSIVHPTMYDCANEEFNSIYHVERVEDDVKSQDSAVAHLVNLDSNLQLDITSSTHIDDNAKNKQVTPPLEKSMHVSLHTSSIHPSSTTNSLFEVEEVRSEGIALNVNKTNGQPSEMIPWVPKLDKNDDIITDGDDKSKSLRIMDSLNCDESGGTPIDGTSSMLSRNILNGNSKECFLSNINDNPGESKMQNEGEENMYQDNNGNIPVSPQRSYQDQYFSNIQSYYDDDDDDCDGVTLSPVTSEVSCLSIPSCLQDCEISSESNNSSSDEDTGAMESTAEKQSSAKGPSEASSSQSSEAATPLIHSTLGTLNMKLGLSSVSDESSGFDIYKKKLLDMFPPITDDSHNDEVSQGLLLQKSHVQTPCKSKKAPIEQQFDEPFGTVSVDGIESPILAEQKEGGNAIPCWEVNKSFSPISNVESKNDWAKFDENKIVDKQFCLQPSSSDINTRSISRRKRAISEDGMNKNASEKDNNSIPFEQKQPSHVGISDNNPSDEIENKVYATTQSKGPSDISTSITVTKGDVVTGNNKSSLRIEIIPSIENDVIKKEEAITRSSPRPFSPKLSPRSSPRSSPRASPTGRRAKVIAYQKARHQTKTHR